MADLFSAVGTSLSRDARTAVEEAVGEALDQLTVEPVTAVVFAAEHDYAALLAAMTEQLPGVSVVGCSGEGVISQDGSREAVSSCAVMLHGGADIKIVPFLVEGYAGDSRAAGLKLAQHVREKAPDARCLCLLPDGLLGNCTAMLSALHEECPELLVVGGTAADSMLMEATFQFLDDRLVQGGVAAFAICGDLDIEFTVSHGCRPIGLQRTVTSSSEGWISEIDGQPAWDVFKEYLDGDPQDLNADGIVHLCVGEKLEDAADDYDTHVIRTPLQLDSDRGALFFPGGGLTEGDQIQLTRRDREKVQASARESAARLVARFPDRQPAMVFQFDCAGRGRILFGGEATSAIVTPLQEAFGDVPWIGLHTFGEIAPISGRPYYHNYTVVLCAVYA